MSHFFYANHENKTTGPVTLDSLVSLGATGQIDDETPVIEEGSQEWSSWGVVRATVKSRSSAEAATAEAVTKVAGQAVDSIKRAGWGSFFFGVLLVILSFFTTPGTILIRSFRNLADWGRARELPTTSSEVPALTFFTIVLRPIVHIGSFVVCILGGWVLAFQIDVPSMLGAWVVGYFGQYPIGWVAESAGVIIRLANDVSTVARNSKR